MENGYPHAWTLICDFCWVSTLAYLSLFGTKKRSCCCIWFLACQVSKNKSQSGSSIKMQVLLIISGYWLLKKSFKKQHYKFTYPMYSIPMIANKITSRISAANCVPIPTRAERRTRLQGGRKTSPCTSFHPDSSLTSRS